ncbi:uncharacterized protein LOC144218361 [Crocuta crocuta]
MTYKASVNLGFYRATSSQCSSISHRLMKEVLHEDVGLQLGPEGEEIIIFEEPGWTAGRETKRHSEILGDRSFIYIDGLRGDNLAKGLNAERKRGVLSSPLMSFGGCQVWGAVWLLALIRNRQENQAKYHIHIHARGYHIPSHQIFTVRPLRPLGSDQVPLSPLRMGPQPYQF